MNEIPPTLAICNAMPNWTAAFVAVRDIGSCSPDGWDLPESPPRCGGTHGSAVGFHDSGTVEKREPSYQGSGGSEISSGPWFFSLHP
jgi:hypothetical protein